MPQVAPVIEDRCRCRSLPGEDHPDQMAGGHETVVMASRSVQQHSTHDAIVNPSAAQGEREGQRQRQTTSDSTRLKQGGY
ncbi:hypothetical protein J3E69DRAFT_333370 [Trichoderma sp. SZMC 28015]